MLGAGGMAGHVVALFLRENGFQVETISAKNKLDKNTRLIDVLDLKKFQKFLTSRRYDAVVNCIGILVKQSEQRSDLAVYINSFLPHYLENFYSNGKTRVIHISSDCVFSTKQSPPYRENSPTDGEGFYDRTKILGEILNTKDLTLRTSIIGPAKAKDGTGLFNWFWQQTGEISGYDKFIWNGITTIELAKAIKAALEQTIAGIYHLVPKQGISKFDLLKLFKDSFGRQDLKIKPDSQVVVDRSLLNTRKDFKFEVSDYQTMVGEMKAWIQSHQGLYPHYS